MASLQINNFEDKKDMIYLAWLWLKSTSSQCARGKSFIAWKPEVHPIFFNGKRLLRNVTLLILNFN